MANKADEAFKNLLDSLVVSRKEDPKPREAVTIGPSLNLKEVVTKKEVDNSIRHGEEAVEAVAKELGRELTPLERRIVELEGYAPETYLDIKGIPTKGVGLTGKYIEEGFPAALAVKVNQTKRHFKDFDNIPEGVQNELVQLMYRGDVVNPDTGRPYKWVSDFNRNRYQEAAEELLNHKEYEGYLAQRKAKGSKRPGGNIPERLEAASQAIKGMRELVSLPPIPEMKPTNKGNNNGSV